MVVTCSENPANKNNSGFSIIEMMIVAGVMSIVMYGSMKGIIISLHSQKVINNLQTEADFKLAIHSALQDDKCFQNLDFNTLPDDPTEANAKTVEELNIGSLQLSTNSDFKDSFTIEKMILEEITTATDQRKLKVYFKRKGLRTLSTRENKICDENDISGCYSYTCNIQYTGGPPLDTCSSLDCYKESGNGHLISHNTFDSSIDSLRTDMERMFQTLSDKIDNISMGVPPSDDPPADPPTDPDTSVCTSQRVVSDSTTTCRTSTQLSWPDSVFSEYAYSECQSFCSGKGDGLGFGGGGTCHNCTCYNGYRQVCN